MGPQQALTVHVCECIRLNDKTETGLNKPTYADANVGIIAPVLLCLCYKLSFCI